MVLAPDGDVEHRLAEIHAGGVGAASRESEREVAGAAAQIERAVARFGLRQLDNPAFPETVQAEALEVVDQIVSPGDGGEEIVDFGTPLFAGVVESVAHADILAQSGGWKSQSAINRALRRRAGFVRVLAR